MIDLIMMTIGICIIVGFAIFNKGNTTIKKDTTEEHTTMYNGDIIMFKDK